MDFYLATKEIGIGVKYKDKITCDDLLGLKGAKRKLIVSKNLLAQREDVFIVPAHLFGLIDWDNFDFQ